MARALCNSSADKNAVMYDCFLCERPFQFGPHIYNGEWLPAWGVIFCSGCLRGNHDGVVLEGHPRLVAHPRERNIKIVLNKKGWLDLPLHGPSASM